MNTKSLFRLGQLVAPLSIAATVALGFASQASAFSLGTASNYNVFVFGDMNQSSDAEGRVAVGGDATFTNFGIGDKLPNSFGADNRLVVGGDLTYNGGQVFGGNAVYGGNLSLSNGAGISQTNGQPDGAFIKGNPIDFGAAKQELTALSSSLGAMNANGSTTYYQWGGIELKAANPGLNVFSLDGSKFSLANNFVLNAAADSTVVINVTGENISLANFGMQFNGGVTQNNVLFNFVNAKNLSSTGLSFKGSVLAALADYTFNNGNLEGTLIANSVSGSGEFHNYQFKGSLPQPEPKTTPVSKVPEPATLAGLGLVAVAGVVSRRRSKQNAEV